jgi:hypothetical protein
LEDTAILLTAILFHDIGMLSQRPEDLSEILVAGKEKMDLATWVRSTHVERMERLVFRLFHDVKDYQEILNSDQIRASLRVAKAHGSWPWNKGFSDLVGKERGLAAIVAVVDLLDEDSGRCDTVTLMRHRQGTPLNIAHWIRHVLTRDRALVVKDRVEVHFVRPPRTNDQIIPVFAALRNHYRMIQLYNDALSLIDIGTVSPVFFPTRGRPRQTSPDLFGWNKISELPTQEALLFHLLDTFFPLSLRDSTRESDENLRRVAGLGMEPVDLSTYHEIRGMLEKRHPIEKSFYAILGGV